MAVLLSWEGPGDLPSCRKMCLECSPMYISECELEKGELLWFTSSSLTTAPASWHHRSQSPPVPLFLPFIFSSLLDLV